jgi:hypothetical protein
VSFFSAPARAFARTTSINPSPQVLCYLITIIELYIVTVCPKYGKSRHFRCSSQLTLLLYEIIAAMRVKVRLLNYQGRPLFKEERERSEEFAGILAVREDRQTRFGRVVLTATLTSQTGESTAPILELYDVMLLWVEDGGMRLRGFEIQDVVEYGQTWSIKVL